MLVLFSWTTYLLISFYELLWVDIFARGGDDGIIHGGYPYTMLEALVRGDWLTAICSPEPTFYFMPGMRYVRFFEMLVFGDAYPLQLTVLLFTPVIYYRFFKELLNPKYAMIICLVMGTGLFRFIGLDFHLHLHSLFILYGEAFSYACLMGGVVILLKGITRRSTGIGCFSLFAIALSIRPNLLFFVSVLTLTYFFFSTFSNADKKYKFIDLLGLSPLLLIPLHNIYFGHQWVPLTTASGIPENMPLHPKMYLDAIVALCGFVAPFEWSQKFINHFYYHGFLGLLLIATNLKIAMRYGLKSKIGALAIACLCGLSMHLFYMANLRYMQPYFVISIGLILVLFFKKGSHSY